MMPRLKSFTMSKSSRPHWSSVRGSPGAQVAPGSKICILFPLACFLRLRRRLLGLGRQFRREQVADVHAEGLGQRGHGAYPWIGALPLFDLRDVGRTEPGLDGQLD